MDKKGIAPLMLGFVLLIGLFLTAVIGGIGLTFSLFKGLTSIPPFVLILIGIVIVMVLIKGRK